MIRLSDIEEYLKELSLTGRREVSVSLEQRDYDSASAWVQFSKLIDEASKCIEGRTHDRPDNVKKKEKYVRSRLIESVDPEKGQLLPSYFLLKDSLVKIGGTNGDIRNSNLYKKMMPVGDVRLVLRLLQEFLSSSEASTFQLSDFKEYVSVVLGGGMPEYRLYMVIGALEQSGELLQCKRGLYKCVNNHYDPDKWLDSIGHLEVRRDLMLGVK